MPPRPAARLLLAIGAFAQTLAHAQAAPPSSCSARSGAIAPLVVELYTSEGCNSCPPADRWVSSLKGRSDVVAFAFHVDYWDRLGWTDRFAQPAWTQRQSERAAFSGARFVYTPQVLVNGRDHRQWPALPAAAAAATGSSGDAPPVDLQIRHEGAAYVVQATPRNPQGAMAPALAGYWVVTEDGHRTQVRAGENKGVLLTHDAVVRELLPVARVDDAPLSFIPRTAADASSVQRQVHFVVTDARTGAPLQAVKLGC